MPSGRNPIPRGSASRPAAAPQSPASPIDANYDLPGPYIPLWNHSAMDIAAGIFRSSQSFQDQTLPWSLRNNLDGRLIFYSTPSRFRSVVLSELPGLSSELQEVVFNFARSQILAQSQRDIQSIDQQTLDLWFPSNQQSHGGGGNSQLPPPPGHLFNPYQAPLPLPGISQAALAAAWNTPLKGVKFAFGRNAPSPISLATVFTSPSFNSGLLSGSNPSVALPSGSHHVESSNRPGAPGALDPGPTGVSSGHRVSGGVQSQFPQPWSSPSSLTTAPSSAGGLPSSDQLPPSSQQFPHLHAALNAQNPQPLQTQALVRDAHFNQVPAQFQNLSPVQFGRSQAPLAPWELAALARPPQAQDPNMMPGFSRKNLQMIIEAAIAKCLALGTKASKHMVYAEVKWPTMKGFTEEDFIPSTRSQGPQVALGVFWLYSRMARRLRKHCRTTNRSDELLCSEARVRLGT
jgi:hypothetical protein